MSALAHLVNDYLVQWGVPTILASGAWRAWRAWKIRRSMEREAPEKKLDSSLARAQKVTIMQGEMLDDANENYRREHEAREAAERRADAAETREREARADLARTTEQLAAKQRQIDSQQEQPE